MPFARRVLCYLLFVLIETAIILGSIVVVFGFYIPFVVLMGVLKTLTGKATPKVVKTRPTSDPSTVS